MAKSGFKRGVVDQFEKDLLATTEIADEFIDRAGDNLIDDLIREAGAGRGPDNVRFQAFSEKYKERKNKAGAPGDKFMHGIKKGGLHMLDKSNFVWKAVTGAIELIWTAKGKQGDYGNVHQEGQGKMPKRTWMHLQGKATLRKIDLWIKRILKGRIDTFNAKYK